MNLLAGLAALLALLFLALGTCLAVLFGATS